MEENLINFEVSSNGDLELFWRKLTSDNDWSLSYAKEVFLEYKKFVWLAKVGQSRVVPSKVIDNVWHLHMTFTKSYWHDLCRDILDFELHHIPSSSSRESQQLDRIQYKNTLIMYEKEFGEVPRERYWPTSEKSKHNIFKYGMFAVFSATSLTACSLSSDGAIITAVKWGVGIYVVFKVLQWLSSNGGSGGGGGGGGCSGSCGGGD